MWDLQQTCRLYAVTDRKLMGDLHFYDAIEAALQGGITMLQLREKHLSEAEYIHVAKQVHELTKRYGVPLIVNDLPQVAMVSGAEGVHVGQSDAEIEDARALLGEEKIIGAGITRRFANDGELGDCISEIRAYILANKRPELENLPWMNGAIGGSSDTRI